MHLTAFASLFPLFLLFQGGPAAAPQPEALPGAKSFVYKSTPQGDLRLHVFAPSAGESPFPVVVFFFGGGWVGGRVQQFLPHPEHLAKRGMVGIVADYRVRGRHRTTPADVVEDARSALAWVREHARELRVDVARLATGGGSAGGHLAACAALLPGAEGQVRPSALVLFNPVLDGAFRADVADLSPVAHVRSGIGPVVIFHGDADTTVPHASAAQFCSKMQAAGNRCDLVTAPGQKHGFFNQEPWLGRTIEGMDAFLVSIGYLK